MLPSNTIQAAVVTQHLQMKATAVRLSSKPTCRVHTASALPVDQQLVCTFSPALGHDKPTHPETAARIEALRTALSQHGLDHQHPQLRILPPPQLGAADVSQLQEVLQLVHPAAYLSRLQEICSSLQAPAMIDDSTYIAPGSYVACCETAAAVLDVLDVVLDRTQQQAQGYCLVRPPGHHVKPSRPMGFGLINFIAVAARYALQQPDINKVLILDWDVHHGNGTEDIFYDSDAVMYISTHQQGLWPYTGKATAIGSGAGQGYTINIPLPGDSGHDSMLAVWQHIVAPAAHRFKPDLVLCSAGYDAHWADPLAGLQFEARTYGMLCQRTAALADKLCQGRCVWILEGGYDVASLSASVAASLSAMLSGEESSCVQQRQPLREEPLSKLHTVLDQVAKLHRLN